MDLGNLVQELSSQPTDRRLQAGAALQPFVLGLHNFYANRIGLRPDDMFQLQMPSVPASQALGGFDVESILHAGLDLIVSESAKLTQSGQADIPLS